MTDGCPPDQVVPDEGKQERGWYPRHGKLRCSSHEIQLLDVLRPGRVGPEADREVEGLDLELSMGRPDDVFVRETNRAQAEIGGAHSCTMPDSVAATTSHIAAGLERICPDATERDRSPFRAPSYSREDWSARRAAPSTLSRSAVQNVSSAAGMLDHRGSDPTAPSTSSRITSA